VARHEVPGKEAKENSLLCCRRQARSVSAAREIALENQTQIFRLGFPALVKTRGSPPSLRMTSSKPPVLNILPAKY